MTGGAIMRAGAVIVVVAAAFCAVAAAPSKPAQNGGRSNPAASAKTAAKPIAKPAVKIPENLDGDPVWGQFPAVMAEYRGGKVTREEFVRYALAAQPNGKKWSRASAARTAPGLLKGMIDERLLAEAQKKAGYLPSAERTRTMLREKYAALPEETVKAIAVEVMRKEKSFDQFLDRISRNPGIQKQAAADAFFHQVVLAKANLKITDQEARNFYNSNRLGFRFSDSSRAVRTTQIMLDARTKQEKQAARSEMMKFARELKKSPGRFNALAAVCALRPDGRLSGPVAPFEPNRKQIYAAYEKAAVKLRPGEITPEPVETEAGIHLIRRDAVQGNRQHSYEEVREELMAYLRERREYEVFTNYLSGLEKAAGVKFHIAMPEFN